MADASAGALTKIHPDVLAYDFGPRKPFKVQTVTISEMVHFMRGYNLNGLGTGKTFCTLAAFDILRKQGLVHKLLVSAPLSTLRFVWAAEVLKATPHLRVEILHGTKAQRLKALARDADVYVVNHDGLATIHEEITLRLDIDALAIDELAKFRNGGAGRTKLMRGFARRMAWVWGLTGGPIPRAVTDVWGQCSIITPDTVPKYFNHLRHQLQYKDGPFRWANREGAVEKAVSHMKPSVRFALSEVTELPPQVTQFVPIEMGPKQKQLYVAMSNKAVALVDGHKIDALNAGAVLSKLLQISLGWVYTRDGHAVALDNQRRVEAIIDYVDATPRKAIIFVPYNHALLGISEALRKEGVKHFVVNGDTPPGKRDMIFNRFQNGPEKFPLLAHPECVAHGLTLTAADTVIWAGPVSSLDVFQQANARIRRIGQVFKQMIIMLGGTAVEKKMYSLLATNELTQLKFLELLAADSMKLLA